MDDLTAVRHAVDRLLEGSLAPVLDLLTEDVEFQVVEGEREPSRTWDHGKGAIEDYFTALGGLAAFWQVDYAATGRQVIAWGKERFTIAGCGLEGGCEFALVFDLSRGRIVRFQIIENLRVFMRRGGSLGEAPGTAWPSDVTESSPDWERPLVTVN